MPVIDPTGVTTGTWEWGANKWLITPDSHGATLSFGEALLPPGDGHGRHNHPESEEILYILSGEGEQMINDEEVFPIRAGDTVYVPQGVFHSTFSTGWQPLRVIAIHNPGGAEKLGAAAPDFKGVPGEEIPRWKRA